MTSHADIAGARAAAFVIANTCPIRPPLVSEISLRLAEESMPIWLKTEEELGELGVPPPFWAFAWAGGQALARYLLDGPEIVSGKSVLDLGSGSGLVAIAAKLAGAKDVLANDIDGFAIEAISINAKANNAAIRTSRDDLIFGSAAAGNHLVYDVICLADLFYERDLACNVLSIAEAARAGGARILAGDPYRSFFPPDRFVKLAEYAVPVTRELEDNEIKRTAVWELVG